MMAAQQLRSVRAKFVKNVKEAIISDLLDGLLQDGVLNPLEKDHINQKSTVIADRARQLIDTVISKGDVASSRMIAHLYESDPALYSELDQFYRQLPQPPQPPQPAAQVKEEME